MKKMLCCLLVVLILLSTRLYAGDRVELDDGRYVDEYGEIHRYKYKNEDIFAPWNDPLKKDDIFAPWNNLMQKSDPFAPWNNPMSGSRETNRYLREQGETDSDYYWK